MLAEAQKLGGVCAFIDAEHAMDPLYAQNIGVDIDELLVSQPDYGEQALEIADMLVRSGAVDVVAVDSVAALTPRAELEGQMGDQTVGLQARMMSQAMRKLAGNLNRTQTLCVFVNQIREKVGVMFGSPETQPGGRALKFYSSQRLDIRRIETLKDGTEAVGNRVRVKVVKNKVAAPFRQAEFDIEFGKGISSSGCILDLGIEHNIVTKSGSFFSYNSERLGQGRNNAKAFLDEHAEIAKEIEGKVYEALGIGQDLVKPIERDEAVEVPTCPRRPTCRLSRSRRPRRRCVNGGWVGVGFEPFSLAVLFSGRLATPGQEAGRPSEPLPPLDGATDPVERPRARVAVAEQAGPHGRRGRRHVAGQARRAGGRRPGGDRADRVGYLDDARYAQRFAEDRRRLDGWGSERIARRLRELGIDREHIDAAIAAQDPEEELAAALELLRRRAPTRRPTGPSATARSASSCAAATRPTSRSTHCAAMRASRPSPSSEAPLRKRRSVVCASPSAVLRSGIATDPALGP